MSVTAKGDAPAATFGVQLLSVTVESEADLMALRRELLGMVCPVRLGVCKLQLRAWCQHDQERLLPAYHIWSKANNAFYAFKHACTGFDTLRSSFLVNK